MRTRRQPKIQLFFRGEFGKSYCVPRIQALELVQILIQALHVVVFATSDGECSIGVT